MNNSEIYYVKGDDSDTHGQPVLFGTRELAEQYSKLVNPDDQPAQDKKRVAERTVYGRTSNSKGA